VLKEVINIDLISYLPEFMQNIKELQYIMLAENGSIEELFKKINTVFCNGFIETLDNYGCNKWEKILDIVPENNEEIESRRLKIKAALMKTLPYTMKRLNNILELLCGADNFRLDYGDEAFTLFVKVGLKAKNLHNYIEKLLYDITPANVVINCELLYNKHSYLKRLSHGGLSRYTHRQLRESYIEELFFNITSRIIDFITAALKALAIGQVAQNTKDIKELDKRVTALKRNLRPITIEEINNLKECQK